MDYQQHVKKKKLAILRLQMLQQFCSVMQQQFLSAKVRK
jgi:HPt (histidine-containing phosphotransfer) domain-containing protein